MKKILMVALTALCMTQAVFFAQAGVFTNGKFVGVIGSEVSAIFAKQPPLSETELSDAIAALLVGTNFSLADDVAQYVLTNTLTLAQKRGIGQGMGRAIDAWTAACSETQCSANSIKAGGFIAQAVRRTNDKDLILAASVESGGWLTDVGEYLPPARIRLVTRQALVKEGVLF